MINQFCRVMKNRFVAMWFTTMREKPIQAIIFVVILNFLLSGHKHLNADWGKPILNSEDELLRLLNFVKVWDIATNPRSHIGHSLIRRSTHFAKYRKRVKSGNSGIVECGL